MSKLYKWGIIGPGKIAEKFAASLQLVNGSKVYAVASRDLTKAQQFAQKFSAGKVYASYTDLVQDAAVDVIYVATPHTFHHSHTLLCLQHKKAVVCEKPMTVNYSSAQAMIAAAQINNTFFMEGMWTRFFPSVHKALELIGQGAIGEVKYLQASFGFSAPFDITSRLYDLKLGGGSLLDVGIYPLFLALLLFGEPAEMQCKSYMSLTGADERTNVNLYYNDGKMATIFSSIVAHTPVTAEISGTRGSITLLAPWYKSETVVLKRADLTTEQFSFPYEGPGFQYEIREVMNCLDKGLIESSQMPHSFSLLMSKTMDEISRQCGLRYDIA